MHEHPIVVGVDGTTTALRAVTWAAEEAHVRRRSLHIVHAAPYLGPAEDLAQPETRRRAEALLARARAVALQKQPDLDVVVRLVPETPISALVDTSADAELLVLGMLGDDAEIVLGPVALDVMTGAHCPVTVVHGHGIDGYGRPAPVCWGSSRSRRTPPPSRSPSPTPRGGTPASWWRTSPTSSTAKPRPPRRCAKDSPHGGPSIPRWTSTSASAKATRASRCCTNRPSPATS